MYPSARLDVDSGTGDKDAPEDEEEEVTLNLRSLCKSSGEAEEDAEEIFPSKADWKVKGNCEARNSFDML